MHNIVATLFSFSLLFYYYYYSFYESGISGCLVGLVFVFIHQQERTSGQNNYILVSSLSCLLWEGDRRAIHCLQWCTLLNSIPPIKQSSSPRKPAYRKLIWPVWFMYSKQQNLAEDNIALSHVCSLTSNARTS